MSCRQCLPHSASSWGSYARGGERWGERGREGERGPGREGERGPGRVGERGRGERGGERGRERGGESGRGGGGGERWGCLGQHVVLNSSCICTCSLNPRRWYDLLTSKRTDRFLMHLRQEY